MSAFGPKRTWLPWRESKDLPRIEHRREPPGGDIAATRCKRTVGQEAQDQAQRSQAPSRTAKKGEGLFHLSPQRDRVRLILETHLMR
jgi:hypothetical protein